MPRVVASALEMSLLFVDVIIVGILLGPAAAGVYATVSRFVSAGALVTTGLRIVVAPRFSALLGGDRAGDVQHLYGATARWILLFGAPTYVVLAAFAPTVLTWLGPGFAPGEQTLLILCVGSVVVLAAGNIQSLLLMSGRSGISAVNKSVVLGVNVALNLALVPQLGIEGAAVAWVLSMVLDTVLAAWQVRRGLGISLALRAVLQAALAVALCVGVPVAAVAGLLGQGNGQLALATVVAMTLLLGYAYVDRRSLEIEHFTQRPQQRR